MSLSLVTEAVKEPVTLEQVKAHARIDTDDDDALLVIMIASARAYVEGATKRRLMTQTLDYSLDVGWPWRYGTQRMTFPVNPVQSVASITYVDGSSPNPTLAADQYTVVGRRHNSYIMPAYGVEWPTVRCVPNAVVVQFVCGDDDDVPPALTQAVLLLASHMYERRDLTTEKQLMEIPYGIESLISQWRPGSL